MSKIMKLTSVALTLLLVSMVAHSGPTVFVAHGGGNRGAPHGGEIGRIDLTTGSYTPLTTLGSLTSLVFDGSYLYTFETQGRLILKIDPNSGAVLSSVPLSGVSALTDMAYDPTTGRFYGAGAQWLFPGIGFYSLDIATGVASFISLAGPGTDSNFRQIAFAPDGTLYMHATNSPGQFWTIDPLSGAVTSTIAGGVPGGALGLAVDPSSGQLIASECCRGPGFPLGERLFSIDPTTGAATLLFDFDDFRSMQDFAFEDQIEKRVVSGPDLPDQLPPFAAPDSITFETLNTTCSAQSIFAFELNGTSLGSAPSDPTISCTCSAPTDSFAVTNAALIASAWSAAGPNDLRFTKVGGVASFVAWTRAVLEYGATSETVCVFDQSGGNCDVPDLCAAGFTEFDLDVTASANPLDGEIDAVVEVGQFISTMYDFLITFIRTGGTSVIEDTVPAEWEVQLQDDDGGNATTASANKKGNSKSATKIEWTPDPGGGSITVWAETRGKPNGTFSPTSCGALRLNDGAKVFDADPGTGEPLVDQDGERLPPILESNQLCLAAVSDVDGNGIIIRDGSGDEDGDGLTDLAEACEIGTDPCVADTDEDGLPDSVDACPLEKPVVDVDGDGCEDPPF